MTLTDFEGKFLRHGCFLVFCRGQVESSGSLADGQKQRGRDRNMTTRFLSSEPSSHEFTRSRADPRWIPIGCSRSRPAYEWFDWLMADVGRPTAPPHTYYTLQTCFIFTLSLFLFNAFLLELELEFNFLLLHLKRVTLRSSTVLNTMTIKSYKILWLNEPWD